MIIEETKSVLRGIVGKCHSFLLRVMGSSRDDCQLSQNEFELKGDKDGDVKLDEGDQSTRDDSRMLDIRNCSTSITDFPLLIDQSLQEESTYDTKKRYYRIVSYKRKIQQENIWKEEAELPSSQQRGNKRQRQIQCSEDLPSPNKKFIDNDKRVITKAETNQNDSHFKKEQIICKEGGRKETAKKDCDSTYKRQISKDMMCRKAKDIFPAKLIIKKRQLPLKSICIEQTENISNYNSAESGKYVLNCSKNDFLRMSQKQISHAPNLVIQNQVACPAILETVNAHRKNIEESILIENQKNCIRDQDLKRKMAQFTLYDSDYYVSKTAIDKIAAKRQFFNKISLNNSKVINFDEKKGDLTLLYSEKMEQES